MRAVVAQYAARRMRAVFFSSIILAIGAIAHATAMATATSQPVINVNGAPNTRSAKPLGAMENPSWAELTPAQQQGLAPLANEWDKLDPLRKSKWLTIGNKFAQMKPEEQKRVQDRMREWVRLTPEQRRMARENYVRAKKLNPDQKSARWQQYQQLPEEQKKKLAADAAARKRVATVLPSNQGKHPKTLPPIKSTPKRVLENSVTPQAASQSAIQPSRQPEQH